MRIRIRIRRRLRRDTALARGEAQLVLAIPRRIRKRDTCVVARNDVRSLVTGSPKSGRFDEPAQCHGHAAYTECARWQGLARRWFHFHKSWRPARGRLHQRVALRDLGIVAVNVCRGRVGALCGALRQRTLLNGSQPLIATLDVLFHVPKFGLQILNLPFDRTKASVCVVRACG